MRKSISFKVIPVCYQDAKGYDEAETDAYRILFGVEVEEENYLKRPMSKFKNDVMRKIREDYR